MDPDLRRVMLEYYDERAAEYEEAYTRGTGTASITEPGVFTREIPLLERTVGGFGHGEALDLACGTGFWLPRYAHNCSRISLFDQSEGMLAECGVKVRRLGLSDRCTLVRGDVFEFEFKERQFDCVLVGFFLSHVSETQEADVFALLKRILRPGGDLLILDSAWTEVRAAFNRKVERQERRLNDGTRFEIHKRYIGSEDISDWRAKHGLDTRIEHLGPAFCAVSGRFS